ncbi:MAG TPA: hypothetical protein VMG59_03315 [Phycisphaerae bacterium]|nr:hypothetical protein [Phycisphaerae bacterium]
MSRASARIHVKPQPNIYTALAAVGTLATLAALIYAVMQYKALIGF